GDRLKAMPLSDPCPLCGAEMTLRVRKNGDYFLGCSRYPECKEARSVAPEYREVLRAVRRLRGLGPSCPFLDFPHDRTIAVLPGPQRDWFASAELGTWTVSTASDRMGIRLDGPHLAPPSREMVSEPVCPGSVQITREGQPIVLGVDGQTIGGYPKIAQVIRA